jgi:hypothetical protein
MARSRRSVAETTEPTTQGVTRMAKLGITELDPTQLNEILSSVPERGAYDRELKDFLASESAGVEISLVEGRFQQKKPQSVKTGFEQAIKRTDSNGNRVAPEGADDVSVKIYKERVFLINDRLAREAAGAEVE